MPPRLLVGALPCQEYVTRSHPGNLQSEPTWFARFCAWLMLVVFACWVVLLNCSLVALVGSPFGSPREASGSECTHKHTHTPTVQPGVAGRSRNPNPSTTQTRTHTPHNSRKPSVHSPGTEGARAMQVTRPSQVRRLGVRLHPKASAALGLEAERATPKHLGTPVPRTCMHALGTGYAEKSGEPLGFRPKKGTCASTGAHPPGETSTSRWRQSALPVLPAAALLSATSQV